MQLERRGAVPRQFVKARFIRHAEPQVNSLFFLEDGRYDFSLAELAKLQAHRLGFGEQVDIGEITERQNESNQPEGGNYPWRFPTRSNRDRRQRREQKRENGEGKVKIIHPDRSPASGANHSYRRARAGLPG